MVLFIEWLIKYFVRTWSSKRKLDYFNVYIDSLKGWKGHKLSFYKADTQRHGVRCAGIYQQCQSVVLTYGPVDAVDPLDVSGHDLDARLLWPPHVLVEQMVRLQIITTISELSEKITSFIICKAFENNVSRPIRRSVPVTNQQAGFWKTTITKDDLRNGFLHF